MELGEQLEAHKVQDAKGQNKSQKVNVLQRHEWICCSYAQKYASIDPTICSIGGRCEEHEPRFY